MHRSFVLFVCFKIANLEELFEEDIGEKMNIGISDTGYQSVKLKCGSDSMHVDLQTDGDFSGVIYTRGSFHEKRSPCFLDPGYKRGQRSFSIKFPLDKCQTQRDGDKYSNILVLQHDKELIMPGDAAFNLECDFRKSKLQTVRASFKSDQIASKITLVDADPSKMHRSGRAFALSTVTFSGRTSQST